VVDDVCKIEAKLAHDVAGAVAKVYKARERLDTAKGDKADPSPYIVALTGARKAGRSAIAALEQHKKEHNC
jgi:hypothetical protein